MKTQQIANQIQNQQIETEKDREEYFKELETLSSKEDYNALSNFAKTFSNKFGPTMTTRILENQAVAIGNDMHNLYPQRSVPSAYRNQCQGSQTTDNRGHDPYRNQSET